MQRIGYQSKRTVCARDCRSAHAPGKRRWNPKPKCIKICPPAQPSDADNAVGKLQKAVPTSVRGLARFLGVKKELGEYYIKGFKEQMAEIVLFDYVLRERLVHNGAANHGEIKAGPVERALNEGDIAAFELAASPEFNQVLGNFTPARVEAFLNNDESRNKMFDTAVLGMLAPVNALGNQPAGQQPQLGMSQRAQPQQAEPPSILPPDCKLMGETKIPHPHTTRPVASPRGASSSPNSLGEMIAMICLRGKSESFYQVYRGTGKENRFGL